MPLNGIVFDALLSEITFLGNRMKLTDRQSNEPTGGNLIAHQIITELSVKSEVNGESR